jgi:hypothetical protein
MAGSPAWIRTTVHSAKAAVQPSEIHTYLGVREETQAGPTGFYWPASAIVSMRKTPKVVPIEEKKTRVVARDENVRRIIVAIGSERLAIDFCSRITKLPPFTGDRPPPILPINKSRAKKKREWGMAE